MTKPQLILPVASSSVLGGVKQGTNVTIDASGIISSTTPAHASTHLPNGSDSLAALVQLAGGGPAAHGYTAWTYDVGTIGASATPTAGVIVLAKLMTPYAFTINAIDLIARQGGSGATPLANCYLGIYDSSGTRQFVSADQSSSWNTNGVKTVTVSGGYTVAAGGFVYLALLVGTQSTTAMTVVCSSITSGAQMSANLTAATYRGANNSSGLSALPSSLTLSSNTVAAALYWFGVR